MKTVVGTVWYMAPEIYERKYSQKCDIWAAGVMLYIMLCGYPPFFGESKDEIILKVKESKLEFDDEVWNELSNEGKTLISKMLSKEPTRPTASQCLKDPWFTTETISKATFSSKTLGRMK